MLDFCFPDSVFYLWRNQGNKCCNFLLKAPEEDEEETQEVATNPAVVREIGAAAAVDQPVIGPLECDG